MAVQLKFADGILKINGRLAFETVMPALKESLIYFKNAKSITIDLAAVEHADSAPLALFCAWVRAAKQKSVVVNFINVPQQLLRIAQISKVDKILGLH